MPTLMLPVYKNDPNAGDWLEGFDVFVIEMTPELARSYLTVMDTVATTAHALKRHDFMGYSIDLYQFRCWDYNGQWFPGDDNADPIVNGEYGDECQPPLSGAEPSRTEGDIVLISEQSIEWTATPKHTEMDVSTASLSRTQLEQIAAVSHTPAQIDVALNTFMREWKASESSVQVAAAADKLAAQLHDLHHTHEKEGS